MCLVPLWYALRGNADLLLSSAAGIMSQMSTSASRVTAHADTKFSLSDAHVVPVLCWVL